MKEVIIHHEQDFRLELRTFLARSSLPSFAVSKRHTPGPFNLLLIASVDGRKCTFAVACKIRPTAKDVDAISASKNPRPLLAAVTLTESLVAHCKARNVNCLDLNGRVWIHEPGLLIDRHEPFPSVAYRLADTEIRFFSPKSTRLARVLLSQPQRTWRQIDLAALTGLSQGLLSRLLNHAAGQGWVEGKRGDWKLVNPNALLDAWEKADVWSTRGVLRQYSTLSNDFPALARQLSNQTAGEIAFTQWFAANLRFPYTQPPVLSAYRRDFPSEDEQRALNLREVADGGKLWLLVPRDAGVFQNVRQVDGLPIVCDAQIYLDLLQVGLRGPDQAKALRAWDGFCKS